MNVYIFKKDKEHYSWGTAMAIVAANDMDEAWQALANEIPSYDLELFSKDGELAHELTSLLSEPSVITYTCYAE